MLLMAPRRDYLTNALGDRVPPFPLVPKLSLGTHWFLKLCFPFVSIISHFREFEFVSRLRLQQGYGEAGGFRASDFGFRASSFVLRVSHFPNKLGSFLVMP